MAKAILCGLESKPKLNGRCVDLVAFHSDKGRWEVALQGEHPPVDLFKIKWHDSWYEPMDDYKDPFEDEKEKSPPFCEILSEYMAKAKATSIWSSLTILDCNGRKVWVFDDSGNVLPELAGAHIPYKSAAGGVVRNSFPLLFQKPPPDSVKTLAVKPSCLRIKEDDSLEKTRLRKVEMSVTAVHPKPALDGQFGQLGPYNATKAKWAVRPDVANLWDVKVDGSPTPVLLRSSEILDESSGVKLVDPVLCDVSGGKIALHTSVPVKSGAIMFEDEPILAASAGSGAASKSNFSLLWDQFLSLPEPLQEDIVGLAAAGPKSASKKSPSEDKWLNAQEVMESKEFKALSANDRERALAMVKAFAHEGCAHGDVPGKFLLCTTLAKLRHSCAPNAAIVDVPWDPESHETMKKAVIAIRDLQLGEEITVNHLDTDMLLLLPTELRQKRLNEMGIDYGACSRCSNPESDRLLRVFCCQASPSSCPGRHSACQETVSTCSTCGAPVADPSKLLSEEQMYVSVLQETIDTLVLRGSSPASADPLVQIVEGATHCGLAPEHWVVCRAQDILSVVYVKHSHHAMAAANMEPVLALQKRVQGFSDWLRLEMHGDSMRHLQRFAEAFSSYADAFFNCKQLSPERNPGSLAACQRLRRKLRLTLDGSSAGAE
mmetsp:Transcript_23659/g.55162  ORF Transcript_23659/g.55162 Transcript_23659/m.55162 type:complete len:659 (-) Transcript_23659:88-2064(-)